MADADAAKSSQEIAIRADVGRMVLVLPLSQFCVSLETGG